MSSDDDPTQQQPERVTAHSYGAIDATDATTECWLIRIPQSIAALWERAPEGTDLGQLVFRKGGASTNNRRPEQAGEANKAAAAATKPSITVHVNESLLEVIEEQQSQSKRTEDEKLPAVLPWNYSLQAMTKKVPVLHPFTRNPKTGSIQLLGMVSRTANLQVLQDQNYRALLKDRLMTTSVTGSRFVKPVEATESVITKQRHPVAAVASSSGSSSTTNKKSFGNAISLIGKRMLEASQESSSQHHLQQLQQQQSNSNKRSRQFSSDQPIRSVVFELFQQQPYWSVKDLLSAAVSGGATHAGTKRSEAEVRDILREIGEYHRSGDHKNMWELRKEFQTQT